ncbi:hypothetical protein [Sphingomonas immobilis]|uniref:Uncharacterized protein n=1 Tax=Sphingomonas immobilis TaxID=3063997 RepID=A0ABT9A1M4_9SPHN|nr:hypothetical protein [Sphingomonas sp. CA1-15]MDO7843732.1 hypothetical protein [Sphingomonas sp. CA1-15]
MQYKIIITDVPGNSVKVRVNVPFLENWTDDGNSSWHAEGGKLRYSDGVCNATRSQLIGPTGVLLIAFNSLGVTLNGFFDSAKLHNSGGSGTIHPGWGGSSMVPGPIQWVDDN